MVGTPLGGWWKYDIRTTREIETAFSAQQCQLDVTLCGQVYVVDLLNNVQYCRDWPSRKRDIKRDKCDVRDVKGIAGILKSGGGGGVDGNYTPPLAHTPHEPTIDLT